MEALIVFAQHHVRADRDIAAMATLRMLNKELTANIDAKYPGYVSDLVAIKAGEMVAHLDSLATEASFDATVSVSDLVALAATVKFGGSTPWISVEVRETALREYATYRKVCCFLRHNGRLSHVIDLRSAMLGWLYSNFGVDSPLLWNAMEDLNYHPVMLYTYSADDTASRKIMPKDMLPANAEKDCDDAMSTAYFIRVT